MSLFVLALCLMQERPVVRLDEIQIHGQLKTPGLIEIESSNSQAKTEEIALKSLIRLEKELLKPAELKIKKQ